MRKDMRDKPELDEFHYHEMTDRLHVMMHSIDTHLQQHVVAEVETELSNHITKAVDIYGKHIRYQVLRNSRIRGTYQIKYKCML